MCNIAVCARFSIAAIYVFSIFSTVDANLCGSIVRGDPASSQISGGAIAGAVVGAVAGVVIIIGLIWFFLRRRRQARAQAQPPSSLQEDGRTPSPMYSKLDNTQPSELHDEPAKESTRPHELDSVTPRELDGQNTSVEIGDKSPVELPAAVR